MIDITTMLGEIPRDAERLLPRANSTYAENCHFGRGVWGMLIPKKCSVLRY